MKAVGHLILHALVLGIALLPWGTGATASEPLPEAITAYYGHVNFAVSCSTPIERATFFHRPERPADSPGGPALSERLEAVRQALDAVDASQWRVEPGGRGHAAAAAEWIQIISVRGSENTAMVRIHVYPLDHESNLLLIARYEQRSGDARIPSDQDRLAMTRGSTPRTEIHFWFLVNGRWVLNRTRIGLVR